MAKHPAADPAVEARRQQRLADCEAGKGLESGQGGDAASNQPQPGPQSGGSGQPGSQGTSAPAAAPVSMAAPTTAVTPAAPAADSSNALARTATQANVSKMEVAFATLTFAVTTGNDDLRANSGAWVTLASPDGTTQKCVLKQGGGIGSAWDENSTREVKCPLSSAMTAEQLAATRFTLEYNGKPNANAEVGTLDPFQTYDNWKVNEVRVMAIAPSLAPQCLIDAKGDPQLVELKSEGSTFQLSGQC